MRHYSLRRVLGDAGQGRIRGIAVPRQYGCLHVVVDTASGYAAWRGEGTRVGVKQHFMALRWICLQHERAAGTQLQMRRQNLAPDAANQQGA